MPYSQPIHDSLCMMVKIMAIIYRILEKAIKKVEAASWFSILLEVAINIIAEECLLNDEILLKHQLDLAAALHFISQLQMKTIKK